MHNSNTRSKTIKKKLNKCKYTFYAYSDLQFHYGNTLDLNLIDRKLVETKIDFIDSGLKDYLYVTSDDNHIINYIKENINKLSKQELLINVMKDTYNYGLSDVFILSLIDKVY